MTFRDLVFRDNRLLLLGFINSPDDDFNYLDSMVLKQKPQLCFCWWSEVFFLYLFSCSLKGFFLFLILCLSFVFTVFLIFLLFSTLPVFMSSLLFSFLLYIIKNTHLWNITDFTFHKVYYWLLCVHSTRAWALPSPNK